MRVAFDLHAAAGQRSGIGVYAACLFEALGALGEREVELVPVGRDDGPGGGAGILRRVVWEQVGLPRRIRAARADLAHVTGFGLPLLGAGCPLVLTVHDLIGVRLPLPGLGARLYWSRILPATVRRARTLIADSTATRDDLVELLGVEPDRVTVVPLAPAPGYGPPREGAAARVRSRHGLSGSFLLAVSAFDHRKNTAVVLEALPRLPGLTLALTGRPGPGLEELQRRALELGVGDRLRWLGFVADDELADLYGSCAVFVYPSLMEGFGLPPLEAMACGAPVVASGLSCLPETLGDGAVLVADPRDPAAVAAAVTSVLGSSALRAALIERGRVRAASFSWERTARATLDVYRRALGGP